MEERKMELTKRVKLILITIVIAIILISLCIILFKRKEITRLSIEMVSPNEGIIIDDPIEGMSVKLKLGRKIKLSKIIYPKNHKKIKTEYIVENKNIAYINDKHMIVGKSVGTTNVYLKTNDGRNLKSNTIKVTIIE